MARRKEDWELLRRRKGTGSHHIAAAGYRVAGPASKPMLEHRLIAERVRGGKPLPPGAEMHHVDGNKLNNAHSNLVICPSAAYHRLLHIRMDALKATGDPRKRRCVRCKQWDSVENMKHHSQNERYTHPECQRQYDRKRRGLA